MKKYYFVTIQERIYKDHILDRYIEHYQGVQSIWFWQSPQKLYSKLQKGCGFTKNIKIESL